MGEAYRTDPGGAFPGEGIPQVFNNDDRLRKLEKELKRVTMERDILKKAMAYFGLHGLTITTGKFSSVGWDVGLGLAFLFG